MQKFTNFHEFSRFRDPRPAGRPAATPFWQPPSQPGQTPFGTAIDPLITGSRYSLAI